MPQPADVAPDTVQPPLESAQQYPAESEVTHKVASVDPAQTKSDKDVFPSVEFENEVNYTEEDDSLCGPDPTISNVAKFLSSCDFSTEEKQEFFFLLSQGLNIDEASDRIYQRRLELFMAKVAASNKGQRFKWTKELFAQTVYGTEKSIRPRFPLRLHGFTGVRAKDVEMLVSRGYTVDQSNFLCDFLYEIGEEYFTKVCGVKPERIDYSSKEPVEQIPEVAIEPPPVSQHLGANNNNYSPNNNNYDEQLTAKINSKSQSLSRNASYRDSANTSSEPVFDEFDEINTHNDDGQPITADTIVQLKRLRNFARGGFKSHFSIENNCAFSEHEALKLGLIVSQQECDYGINMYDALLPSDEQQIEQLIRTGLTLDEAILKVFESRFGKTKLDSSALNVSSIMISRCFVLILFLL